ncbi:MAG: LexA family protein [Bacteroidia bacterium]
MKHLNNTIEFIPVSMAKNLPLPFVGNISAGFPSPAEEYLEQVLDFNKDFIKHPSSTFYGRVKGNSMIDAGIRNGDLLVIDKSLQPVNGDIAVCYLNGAFTVKKLKVENNTVWLVPYNKEFAQVKITPENDFMIWGIVLHVIHSYR